MNKEEIQKQIAADKDEIDRILSKAILLSTSEITKLDHLYAHMESMKFQLRALEEKENGSK